jgi:hypothetical protein
MTVTRSIAVRWEKNKKDFQSELVGIFSGLILNDLMTNSILGILCRDPAVEDV